MLLRCAPTCQQAYGIKQFYRNIVFGHFLAVTLATVQETTVLFNFLEIFVVLSVKFFQIQQKTTFEYYIYDYLVFSKCLEAQQ